jgi:hypothetical protein
MGYLQGALPRRRSHRKPAQRADKENDRRAQGSRTTLTTQVGPTPSVVNTCAHTHTCARQQLQGRPTGSNDGSECHRCRACPLKVGSVRITPRPSKRPLNNGRTGWAETTQGHTTHGSQHTHTEGGGDHNWDTLIMSRITRVDRRQGCLFAASLQQNHPGTTLRPPSQTEAT